MTWTPPHLYNGVEYFPDSATILPTNPGDIYNKQWKILTLFSDEIGKFSTLFSNECRSEAIVSKYLSPSTIKLGFAAHIIKLPFVVVKIIAQIMVSVIHVPQIGTHPLAVLIA
jgi:hypothetical protein